jgi:hypothetical protein
LVATFFTTRTGAATTRSTTLEVATKALRTGFLHEPTHSPPKDVEQSAAQTIAKIKLFI